MSVLLWCVSLERKEKKKVSDSIWNILILNIGIWFGFSGENFSQFKTRKPLTCVVTGGDSAFSN